jgi:methylmalonyl-CoA/ethylmalonyl-CoA epimerase
MLNKIYHLGYAVEDIEAASRFYRENFGAESIGPELVEEQGIIAMMFRVGESMVELVQPTGPDTPVGRFLARRGEGFHHVAYQVDDLETALRKLRKNGVEIVDQEPRIGARGTRMAFLHPNSTFGVLIELVELSKRGG